jgi:hypothetical protein
MKRRFSRVAVLFAMLGAGLLAIPQESSAHCLPGDYHMSGYVSWSSGQYCNSYWDSGCVYRTNNEEPYEYCSSYDPETEQCYCWTGWYYYACDGC